MSGIRQFSGGFRNGMHNFGENICLIINSALLFLVYFTGVGITSIAAKLSGKHFLDMQPKEDTYWSELNLKKKPAESYYRQF